MTRKGRKLFCFVILGIVLSGTVGLAAQQVEGPMVFGPFPAFRADIDVRDLPVVAPWQPGDPIFIVPEGYPEGPELEEQLFTTEDISFAAGGPAAEIPEGGFFSVNVAGLGFSGAFPPDTVGDVGLNHYIQAVNVTNILILNKSGAVLAGPFQLDSLWTAGGNCASGAGDPIVVYDGLADRWLLAEFDAPGGTEHLCIYVSQTPDPVSGGWFLFDLVTPQFPDYPKYGVWPDAYYASTFEGANLAAYALDRTAMLAGLPTTFVRFTIPALLEAPRSTRLLPAHFDGGATPTGEPNFYVRSVEAAQDPGNPVDRLEIYEFHVDFGTPANSTFTLVDTLIPTPFVFGSCTGGPPPRDCVPQPGTANELDALGGRLLMQNQFRNFGSHFSLVDTQPIDAGGDIWGNRWYELRRSAVDGANWSIFQEGTHSPDSVNRWMGSIAMNGAGDIALGYSVSDGTSTFPGIRVAGRTASDPAGTLPQGEFTAISGSASQTGLERWGDYSAMNVDPADDATFWYTTEYLPASQWQTRIVAFRLNTLFTDGFESGDTAAWDVTTN